MKNKSIFKQIILLGNLFIAWKEFKRGKSQKTDVQSFAFDLNNNLLKIQDKLKSKTWKPCGYISFYVKDPKLRNIHKASVKDRVLNQALYRVLYNIFDKTFIFDSYSSRIKKGTHKAILRTDDFIRKESNNYKSNIFVLKCDIQKFFDSISHDILLSLIKNKIFDDNTLWLIESIIKSFEKYSCKGIPLGNVTSQLFANIYLNELDQFMKHKLKIKYYVRYCDDFIILSKDKYYLEKIIKEISNFLKDNLNLNLHPRKITIRKVGQGIDFLGYVTFPHHRILRTKTRRRMFKKIKQRKEKLERGEITKKSFEQTLNSYYGMLSHCKGFKIRKEISKIIGVDK